MNEKRIREVIDVEKQAMDLVAQANREAEQLPRKAEVEAAAMIEQSRAAAEDEARQLIQSAQRGRCSGRYHRPIPGEDESSGPAGRRELRIGGFICSRTRAG